MTHIQEQHPNSNLLDHEEMGLLMSLALDHMLDPQEQEQLERHLAQCPPCARQWRIWQTVDSRFQDPPLVEPPADFALRLEARLARREQRHRLWVALGLGFLTIGVWVASILGIGVLLSVLAYQFVPWAPHLLLLFTEVWANVVALGSTTWQLLMGLVRSPATLLAGAGYLLFCLLILGLWTRFLRRSTGHLAQA